MIFFNAADNLYSFLKCHDVKGMPNNELYNRKLHFTLKFEAGMVGHVIGVNLLKYVQVCSL